MSEFNAKAADWLRRVADTDAPVVVTLNGRPAGVLLSPRPYDELNERARVVAAVEEGLAEVEAGRVHAHDEAVSRVRARFPGKPK